MSTYNEEWHRKLIMADSQNRAEVLAAACAAYKRPAIKRALLRDYFSVCDALAPFAADLRWQFEQAGFVTDNDETLPLPTTVYRGAWEDDDTGAALSWTRDIDTARRFAKGLFSLRSRIVLGMYRPGLRAYVFRAVATEGYGWLTGRGEDEVIAKRVVDCYPIEAWGTEPA